VRRLARFLLYAGPVAVVVGLSKVHAAWVADPAYDYTGSSRFAWSIIYVMLLGLSSYGLGLPDLTRSWRSAFLTAAAATGVAAFGMSVLQLVIGSQLIPRFTVLGAPLILTPWYVLCARLHVGGHSRAEDRDRVVLVAEPEEIAIMREDLTRNPERPALLVATLVVDEARSEESSHRPLIDRAVTENATVVVLARSALADESVVVQAAALHEAGIRVRTLSLFYEEWLGKLPLAELERVSLMFDIGELHRARYGRFKRVLDLVFGFVGASVLLLVIPVVLVGNVLANRGPLFYRQPRIGKQGHQFEILKFRTMDAKVRLPVGAWTSEDDPRITPFGRWLRRTHLDELPQAVNIVRGDLSVVGPRPEQPHYVAELSEKLPFYDLRHLVRPGLTGWAQVKYGYAGSETDALEKLQYEFFYLRRQGLTFDLKIVGRTLRSVIGLRGR
jgi:lipopolysaccharide/colanic/teichoic acid biosynthesis glycosyltransferase